MITIAPKTTLAALTGLAIVSLTSLACTSQRTSHYPQAQTRPTPPRTAPVPAQTYPSPAVAPSRPQAHAPAPTQPRGGSVIEFTSANFDSTINRPGAVVLIDFAADWCGPCRQLAPTIDQVAQNFAGQSRIVVGRVDVDQQPELSDRYGVEILPTLLYVKNGQVQKTSVGPASAQEIAATLTALAQ